MNHEENALRKHIDKIEKQNELMKQLSSREGFYKKYFEELPTSKTHEEAFNRVNELYEELFGELRYADFNSFRAVSNYYHKKNKNK